MTLHEISMDEDMVWEVKHLIKENLSGLDYYFEEPKLLIFSHYS